MHRHVLNIKKANLNKYLQNEKKDKDKMKFNAAKWRKLYFMFLPLGNFTHMMPESCSLELDIIIGSSPKKLKDLMKT